MRFEADELTLLGGVRHGRTLGAPVAIEIGNSEWPKWAEEMKRLVITFTSGLKRSSGMTRRRT